MVHVGHLHGGRLAGALVLPRVVPERHDGVTVGHQQVRRYRKVVADPPESHEDAFEHCLTTDVGASERKSVGLYPLDVVGHDAENGGDVASCETRVDIFDEFFVRCHLGIETDRHCCRQLDGEREAVDAAANLTDELNRPIVFERCVRSASLCSALR